MSASETDHKRETRRFSRSQVEENEIRDFFARFGEVKEVKIITYRGGICKGSVVFV